MLICSSVLETMAKYNHYCISSFSLINAAHKLPVFLGRKQNSGNRSQREHMKNWYGKVDGMEIKTEITPRILLTKLKI